MGYTPKNPNGQDTMSDSQPVVIASDQTAVPVSGTVTANLGTLNGASTSAKQDTGNTSVASIDTKTPALGQALAAASVPVVLTSAQIATLTPVTTVTAAAQPGVDIGDVTINNASGASAVNIQDGGNSITVDGAVSTSNLPTTVDTNSGNKSASTVRMVLATDQPQLTNALKVDGSAVTQPVSLTSTTITGTVTADTELTTADLDTGAGTDTRAVVGLVGSKSGGGVLIPGDATAGLKVDLGADNDVTVTSGAITETNSAAIKTAVETIDNAVSGAGFNITQFAGVNNATGSGTATGALRVELPTNGTGMVGLAAGTNAVGKLSANSGVDIGDVDVTSVPTDPFGANADAASASGSISAKLRQIATNGIPVTGTVTVGSHAVTNAGVFATQVDGAALTSLQLIDDVVYTDDTSTHATGTSKGVGFMAAATPTDTSVNANDIAMLAMTTDRKLHVSVQDSLPAGTAAIGKLAANSGVIIGDVNVTTLPVAFNTGSASATTQRVIAATDSPEVTSLQILDDTILADDGTGFTLGTTKAGVIGGVAVETDGTDPLSVSAEGDVAVLRTDRNRRLLVNTAHPRMVSASENNATAQTNNPILSAPGASLSLYITDIVVSNGATAGSIRFVEDTAGTPVIKVQETYMAITGGAVMNFTTPIRITANKDFGYTSTTVTTHSITVNGYIAP